MNIDETAWTGADKSTLAQASKSRGRRGGGTGGSPFPAQIRFEVTHEFPPLPEASFRHIVTYTQRNIFDFRLSTDQVAQLMNAFIERAGVVSTA